MSDRVDTIVGELAQKFERRIRECNDIREAQKLGKQIYTEELQSGDKIRAELAYTYYSLILQANDWSKTEVERVRAETMKDINTINITLGNGNTITGDIVAAKSIADSFNRIHESDRNTALKETLQQLTSQVGALIEHMDKEQSQQVADDLEALSKEVLRKKPRRRFWELTVEGLKEAAKTVGKIGGPVIETVSKLAPLITALSA